MLQFLAFRTFNVGGFLVFGVPNAKNLPFGTHDVNTNWFDNAMILSWVDYDPYFVINKGSS